MNKLYNNIPLSKVLKEFKTNCTIEAFSDSTWDDRSGKLRGVKVKVASGDYLGVTVKPVISNLKQHMKIYGRDKLISGLFKLELGELSVMVSLHHRYDHKTDTLTKFAIVEASETVISETFINYCISNKLLDSKAIGILKSLYGLRLSLTHDTLADILTLGQQRHSGEPKVIHSAPHHNAYYTTYGALEIEFKSKTVPHHAVNSLGYEYKSLPIVPNNEDTRHYYGYEAKLDIPEGMVELRLHESVVHYSMLLILVVKEEDSALLDDFKKKYDETYNTIALFAPDGNGVKENYRHAIRSWVLSNITESKIDRIMNMKIGEERLVKDSRNANATVIHLSSNNK